MDTGHQHDRTAARRDSRLPAKVVVAALLLIVGVSLFVHLRGLTHDLPAPGADEPYFVLPAARMAWKGDADPQWFGHPGSTVIYPLALAYRAREVVFHGAPLFGAAPSLAARFRSDPSSFYEIGRIWVMLLSVATVPLLFLLGRRVFGDLTGLLAAGAWALVPLAISYGTIVRTDAAGACFGLASLLLCVLALDDPKPRRFALAGLAIGFAVVSRYFMVTLVPVLVAAWIVARVPRPHARSLDGARRRARCRSRGVRAHDPLLLLGLARRGTLPPGRDGRHGHERHVRLVRQPRLLRDRRDTQRHLVGRTRPGRRRSRHRVRGRDAWRLLLAGFVVVFLGIISLSTLHWQRWSIQVLPVVLLFAASAVVAAATVIGRVFSARARASVGTGGARGGRRDRPRRGPCGVPRRLRARALGAVDVASSCGAG